MKGRASVAAVIAIFAWGLMNGSASAEPVVITLDVDVGSGASIGMGPGGMGGSLTTGGGPMEFDGQQIGTFMHSTSMATMQGMMGGQTLQHRVMDFDFPGFGTCFAVMAGGAPWIGAKGIIMGGTDGCHGLTGSIEVDDQVGPTRYHFTLTFP